MDSIPDLTGLTPDATKLVSAINLRNPEDRLSADTFGVGFTPDFAARFTGGIRIPAAGIYTFILGVDDGARLTIDGGTVVEVVGMGDFTEATGSVSLPAGTLPIEIEYFQAMGDAELQLSVIGPGGGAGSIVPLADFFQTPDPFTAVTDVGGLFSIPDVPTILGDIQAEATATANGDTLRGSSARVPPVLAEIKGITDVGNVVLRPVVGCSDGEREGFVNLETHPDIAGCSGAWSIPGILSTTLAPVCDQQAGDDGTNSSGAGCNVADLCAPGWHVCATAQEIAANSPTGCASAAPSGASLFFASRQSSTGCIVCATGTRTDSACNSGSCASGCLQTDAIANDVFGCGNVGAAISNTSCGVLNRFSQNGCGSLPSPWSCAGSNGFNEAHLLTKSGTALGGVLCCRN